MRLEQLQKRRNNNEKHGIKDNEKTANTKKKLVEYLVFERT